MKFEISDTFPASVAQLSALLASKELTGARAEKIAAVVAQNALPPYSFTQEKNAHGEIKKTHFTFTISDPAVLEKLPFPSKKPIHFALTTHFSPAAPAFDGARVVLSADAASLAAAPAAFTAAEDSLTAADSPAGTDSPAAAALQIALDLPALPVKLHAGAQISTETPETAAAWQVPDKDEQPRSKLTYFGEIKVNLPFFGKIVETKISAILPKLLKADFQLLSQFLAQTPSQ